METTEKKVSHTPGPWGVNHWSNGERGISCLSESEGITYFTGDAVTGMFFGIRANIKHDQYHICGSFEGAHICNIEDSEMQLRHDEAKANAKLIAAAPELLESLQWLIKQIPELKGEISLFGMQKCYDAIKKATE